ncbi:M24 family metallopeptidase, partial [Candidatus Woesearchaeota archaeon]|nr:M24 family metallopeptidase [Candidatus Woesearchaeota archaeon]
GFNFGTESELAGFIESRMRSYGVTPGFNTIVASGKNSSMPHHIPSKAKIRGFCVMDFGVGYKHLNSDFTRTVYIGRAKDTEVRVFNAVLEAERAILKAIKPGMKCSELARIGKRALGNYSKHILHSFGHGVGVDVHESPVISESSNQVLKPGMVLAVEPGVYLPGKFGVRLEDMALVTEQSMKLLTKPLDTLITL